MGDIPKAVDNNHEGWELVSPTLIPPAKRCSLDAEEVGDTIKQSLGRTMKQVAGLDLTLVGRGAPLNLHPSCAGDPIEEAASRPRDRAALTGQNRRVATRVELGTFQSAAQQQEAAAPEKKKAKKKQKKKAGARHLW
jgi:hypothetical protein